MNAQEALERQTIAGTADPGAVRRLFWMALAIRLVVGLAIHFGMDGGMAFAPDQITYANRAQVLARSWSGDLPASSVFIPGGPAGYYYIVAAVYFVFGPYALFAKILNCFVGALSVPFVYDLTLRLGGGSAAALRAAGYAVWFPSLVLWSTLNIRDAWIVLVILLVSREALALQAEFRLWRLLAMAAGMLALIQFRAYVLLPVAAPVVLSFFVQRSRNLARNLILGSLAAVVLIYADQAAGASRNFRFIDLEQIQQHRDWNAYGAASRFEKADISTPDKAIVFLPKGLVFFLLAPFPWMLGSMRQVLAVPETLFFYWLLPHIFRGGRHLLRHHLKQSLMVVLITAALTFGYALGEGNAGTAYRHRAQILCFFLVFGAVGVEMRRAGATDDVGTRT